MDIDTALHELLLTRPVTENDIVQAHRRMAMRFHPDKAADPDEKRWAQQKFIQVQEAYELLKGLPIETINASPDYKISQETTGGSRKQPEISKKCPSCAQQIQYEAIKCPFCRQFVDQSRTQQPGHEGPHPSHSSASWAGQVLFLCLKVLLTRPTKVRISEIGPRYSPRNAGRSRIWGLLSWASLLVCSCFAFGLVVLPLILYVSTPQRLSGSPVLPTKETPDLSWDAENAAAAKEFQQTFGRLLGIERGPDGRCFAYFERIKQPVYNDQRSRGFWVRVLPHYVIFFREHGSGTGTCRLSQ